jgi:hypothetical protein
VRVAAGYHHYQPLADSDGKRVSRTGTTTTTSSISGPTRKVILVNLCLPHRWFGARVQGSELALEARHPHPVLNQSAVNAAYPFRSQQKDKPQDHNRKKKSRALSSKETKKVFTLEDQSSSHPTAAVRRVQQQTLAERARVLHQGPATAVALTTTHRPFALQLYPHYTTHIYMH